MGSGRPDRLGSCQGHDRLADCPKPDVSKKASWLFRDTLQSPGMMNTLINMQVECAGIFGNDGALICILWTSPGQR